MYLNMMNQGACREVTVTFIFRDMIFLFKKLLLFLVTLKTEKSANTLFI